MTDEQKITEALNTFHEACRMLQEAGMPVQAGQLTPSSDTGQQRVIVLIENALCTTTGLVYVTTETS